MGAQRRVDVRADLVGSGMLAMLASFHCVLCALLSPRCTAASQVCLGLGLACETKFVAVTFASMARTAAVCIASGARHFGDVMSYVHLRCSSLQRIGNPS